MTASTSKVTSIRLTEIGDDHRIQTKVIMKEAKAACLDDVLIVGRDDSGELWARSSLNAGQSLWLLEKLRARILDGNPWTLV